MTTTEREAKLRKAQALRRKEKSTTSEAEAMACIALIRRLQAECGLTMEEIDAGGEAVSAEHFKDHGMYSGDDAWNHVDMNLTFDIGRFCRVKVGTEFRHAGGAKREYFIHYFGHEADVDNAVWLRNTIRDAMLWEWEIYRDFVMPKGSDQRTARKSFSMGMAARLRERMVREEEQDDEQSTALTIRVNALVEKRAAEVGFVEAKGSARRVGTVDGSAYSAGQAAGSRVNIGRGVTHRSNGGATGPKLIT